MTPYIRSISGISPGSAPGAPVIPVPPAIGEGNRLTAIEPEYGPFFDAKQIRRTSRIVRMGVAAALHCLRNANQPRAIADQPPSTGLLPDAIVTGTAYGCLEDTASFLERLIHQQEEMLSPTAFIQSTHNTIGAQIALLLQCTAYNNVFVQRGHSFESALLDAMLLLADRQAKTVLAGAIDEITPVSSILLQRFGLTRHQPIGEGAFFFLLAAEPSAGDWARIDGLQTLHGPQTNTTLDAQLREFLAARSLTPADIDHVLTGHHHPPALLAQHPFTAFKTLCGEYPTATAFALGLAASQIKAGQAGRILICNSYLAGYHSFILVSDAAK